MNPATDHDVVRNAEGAGEPTLRLIASLPAPAGLEDRVKEGLRAAPRTGQVLRWPSRAGMGGWMQGKAVRAAAAAAIVFVVAGGGWGVYSRVQPARSPKVIAMPQRLNVVKGAGGFSSAGAMRTPQTLDGPVLTHPVASSKSDAEVKAMPAQKKSREEKPARKKINAMPPMPQ
jgi:hypothetical protein